MKKTAHIHLRDKLRFLTARPIKDNPSVLEGILGKSVSLREFSGSWRKKGVFIEESEGQYLFLSRSYSDPNEGGRGNIIIAGTISPYDIILKFGGEDFIVKFPKGGGGAIYDEKEQSPDAITMFYVYNQLLTDAGIPPLKKDN